jgi:hypothetical protein
LLTGPLPRRCRGVHIAPSPVRSLGRAHRSRGLAAPGPHSHHAAARVLTKCERARRLLATQALKTKAAEAASKFVPAKGCVQMEKDSGHLNALSSQ